MSDKIIKGHIDDYLWRKILEKMYDAQDLRQITMILDRELHQKRVAAGDKYFPAPVNLD